MLPLDLDGIRRNVADATTEDLLDRATVYRRGMEAEALDIIEEELRHRGVAAADLAAHAEQRRDVLWLPDGTAKVCSFCRRPAVAEGWGWRRLHARGPGIILSWLPIPWFFAYCEQHRPREQDPR